MATPRTFGRRTGAQSHLEHKAPCTSVIVLAERAPPAVEETLASSINDELSIDDELREWKRTRRKNFAIPWQQLSLMAGLCFGIASLVLPGWINSAMQWPLYALTAMSFFVWLRKRKSTRK